VTGHPTLVVPNGFRGPDAPVFISPDGDVAFGPGTPVALTFVGNLFGEAKQACESVSAVRKQIKANLPVFNLQALFPPSDSI
jgi:hypothetical protein